MSWTISGEILINSSIPGNVSGLIAPANAAGVNGSSVGGTAGGGGTAAWNDLITHGEQLQLGHVGPWSLQGVAKGSETLQTASLPSGRGYWQIENDTATWAPTTPYVWNRNPTNRGGIVPAGGVTLTGIKGPDGVTDVVLPAGTIVAQFRDFSLGDFSAQGQGGSYAFIGCRFRNGAISQASQFNDFNSTYKNRLFFCDMGSPSTDIADWEGSFWKQIGGTGSTTPGAGSGISRTYCSLQYVTFQPNVDGAFFTENIVENLVFWGGEAGPPGQGGDPLHMAALGCEGGRTGFVIDRNSIVPASPDVDGNVFTNGATIAMEGTSGGAYTNCSVRNNLLGGINYVILNFGEKAGSTGIVVTGNKVSTKYWTNGGKAGVEQVGPTPPTWGSNGNVKSGNVWADDYGSGGDGNTPTSSRQYPLGNGPRKGTTAF